jgi:DNA-directed RNA polymerase sigma subunit (sigma70/sigma32)
MRYADGALDQFLREVGRHRLLTATEELALARRIERGDLAAKDELVTYNLGAVGVVDDQTRDAAEHQRLEAA